MGRTSKAILLTPAAWDNCGLPEHLLVAFSACTIGKSETCFLPFGLLNQSTLAVSSTPCLSGGYAVDVEYSKRLHQIFKKRRCDDRIEMSL